MRSRPRTARTSAIGYVYLGFGVLTTFIMLAAVWFGDDDLTSQLLTVVVVLVVIWLAYMLFALRKVFVSSNVLFEPLGLTLTEMPMYVPTLIGSGGRARRVDDLRRDTSWTSGVDRAHHRRIGHSPQRRHSSNPSPLYAQPDGIAHRGAVRSWRG